MRTLLLGALLMTTPAAAQDKPGWTLVIHGGAGVIERARMTPEREAAARAGLNAALDAGQKVLSGGGTAVDAVFDVVARAARFARPCPTDAQIAERVQASRETVRAALAELVALDAIAVRGVAAPTLRRVTILSTGMQTGEVR